MKISIFGMGYVGVVSAACLANDGHNIVGVDPVAAKIRLINEGKAPIIEKDVGEMIHDAVTRGQLRATTDTTEAVQGTSLSLVCVGTPSQLNGNLDLRFVRRVCEEIGACLKEKCEPHIVAIRSTILPGTMRNVVIPTLEERSGKTAGVDFGVCNNPEFLREGTAVYDFYNPPKTVLGEIEQSSGDVLATLYERLDAPLVRTDIETAEMVKYTDNCWHALKVGFANEIGNICKIAGIDSHRVMNIFCQDTKLNLSAYYLRPGFAFGGSCLPKDLRALTYLARSKDLETPILNSILQSNKLQVERGLQMVQEKGARRIGVLGFSFKAGTDDLRESPIVELIERLLGRGCEIRIYDKNVHLSQLVGGNRDYLLNHIPHISRMMVGTIEDVLAHGEVVIIGNGDAEFRTVLEKARPGQVVIDLVRIGEYRSEQGRYDGICW